MSQDAVLPPDAEAQIAGLKAQIDARDRVIAMLRAQLARLRRMTFGTSSEKLAREIEQLELALEEQAAYLIEPIVTRIRDAGNDRRAER